MRTFIKILLVFHILFFMAWSPANAQFRRHRSYGGGIRIFEHHGYGINYGGFRYHYNNGFFYRPFGSFFRVVLPPIGIRIGFLPYGYSQLYLGGYPYYYYNGTFYRPWEDGSYEVITAPVGAEVAELPHGARVVVIDHKKYFEYNGTYYKETIKENGEVWYTVTGRNGEIQDHPDENNQTDNYRDDEHVQKPSEQTHTPSKPKPGMEVTVLPDGSKTVITNNQKYFVSPDDTYYKELIENNEIYYRVVPKPVQ